MIFITGQRVSVDANGVMISGNIEAIASNHWSQIRFKVHGQWYDQKQVMPGPLLAARQSRIGKSILPNLVHVPQAEDEYVVVLGTPFGFGYCDACDRERELYEIDCGIFAGAVICRDCIAAI